MSNYFIGIDTSNYTTSVAIIDDKENLIANERMILTVKKGNRGLRQQEALFQHVMNLPHLIENAVKEIDKNSILAVSVSDRPRPVPNSYMPCFMAGVSLGKSLANVLNISFMTFSHQEGHIAAVLPRKLCELNKYLSFHLSGGTCELLCVNNNNIHKIGGSLDISFGQLIDRIGVALGYDFPAGKAMDEKAVKGSKLDIVRPIKTKNLYFNLSGIETKILTLMDDSTDEEIAGELFRVITSCIENTVKTAIKEQGKSMPVVMVGGVSSSKYIRGKLAGSEIDFIFGEHSADNAVGTALLGKRKFMKNRQK